MSSLRRTAVLAVLLALAPAAACGSAAASLDGGPGDGSPGLPPRHLAFESFDGPSGARMLRPGDRLPFAVLYTENDGSPVIGQSVSFALVGSAHDSSLTATSAVTDGHGRATGTLTAGAANGTFELRASADRATPAHVDVSVSDAGFGALRVTVRYEGTRTFASRVVGVAGSAHCAEALAAASLDREVIADASATTVMVDALPAATAYAVVARGLASDGRVLAEGCVEGAAVTPDATTSTSVSIGDLSPGVYGTYDVALTLHAETSAIAVVTAVVSAESAALAGSTDATFYLDAIDAHLRASGDAAGADALAAARGATAMDDGLATALGPEGPTLAVSDLALRLSDGTRGLVLGGVLVATPAGDVPDGSMVMTDVLTSGLSDLSTTPAHLSTARGALHPTVTSLDAHVDAATGTLVVRQLVVSLPLGTATEAVLDARRTLSGAATTADLLATGAGCSALVSWAATEPALDGVCDATCVQAACDDALGRVAASIETALEALDSSRGALALVGVAILPDANDDGVADGIGPATIAGTWGTGSTRDGDPLTVRLEAVHE